MRDVIPSYSVDPRSLSAILNTTLSYRGWLEIVDNDWLRWQHLPSDSFKKQDILEQKASTMAIEDQDSSPHPCYKLSI